MSDSPATNVALSLASALSWGGGDFSGGLASKKARTFEVVAVAHATGLLLVAVLSWLRNETYPGNNAMFWGAMAGLAGVVGLSSLYKGLAVGKMGIVAPVGALVTAILPVVYGIGMQGAPKRIQLVGFLLAAIAIVLISKPERAEGVPKGLGLAVLAGVGFGLFLVCINRAGNQTVYWPLIAARVVSLACMLLLVAVTRGGEPAGKRPWGLMLLAGVLDTAGNALFVLATQFGRLDVAAVLSSLYPASTVLLARFILHEKLNAIQTSGMIVAIISIPLIAGAF